MDENIILIGFMGAGKTSVGMNYAKKHQKQFVDTDRMIEEQEGMSISELFQNRGEESFRRLETAVLRHLCTSAGSAVISVGGGLPLREENRQILKKLGTAVYLKIEPRTVLQRLEGDTTRPLLQGEDAEEKVKKLLEIRNPIYTKAADWIIVADGKTLEEITDEIESAGKRA